MQAAQTGCAICHGPPPRRSGRYHVDHDHKTKKVRGLLCNNCNVLVGMARENPDVLQEAIAYLARSSG